MHALRRYFARFRQAEHLEAAGIRQQGFIPVHEAVQAAVTLDDLHAGTQHQVERVAEDDLAAQQRQFLRGHALDRSVGADRHEHRGFYDAARAGDAAAPGFVVLCQ